MKDRIDEAATQHANVTVGEDHSKETGFFHTEWKECRANFIVGMKTYEKWLQEEQQAPSQCIEFTKHCQQWGSYQGNNIWREYGPLEAHQRTELTTEELFKRWSGEQAEVILLSDKQIDAAEKYTQEIYHTSDLYQHQLDYMRDAYLQGIRDSGNPEFKD